MRILTTLLLILISSTIAWARPINLKAADSEWVETKLKRLGFSNSFSEESAKYYEPKGFKSVVTLNLLGFLTPSGAHLTELDPKAVQKSSTFIKANPEAFQAAQKQFGVPAEVVSSLLYIETRHGADMGTFHIVSVYVHLMQVNSPANLKELTRLALLKNKEIKKYSTAKEVREIMKKRVESKSKWAEEQLIALAEIRKKKHLNLKKLRGSYAGAFGLPQFIPSSYRDFAESLEPDATPDITKPADAIMSVANYLQKSGWKQKNLEAQVTALMKYNNSRDYANGILNISQRVPPLPPLETTATIEQTQ
ncbi:lytic murein transglycosylase [Bdellovibrio sp. HCB185ZH]|uniref:lytic murein transglycosylase n=1 Tax=Bdellovibrio sp. HCB185ZH TaxID=3394235 RepID=UPI0039A5E75B